MKWPLFTLFAFLVVAVQLSLRNVLTLESLGFITPDLVAVLAVFITLFAHRAAALWACWMLGMAMDLAPQASTTAAHVIGPHALGYVFGGYVVLQLRTMVFRRRALTMGFLTFACVLAASVVAVAIFTVRSWYAPEIPLQAGPVSEMVRRFGIALYSGLIAIPVGWLLGQSLPIWGFQNAHQRRAW
jgi:rod shape-determining protein MreD